MSDVLNKVLDQAEAAARDAGSNDTSSNALVATQQGGGDVATRPSLDSMMDSSGISVDGYLTLKYEGIRYADVAGLFQEFEATIDMSQVVPITQVRGNNQGTTTFIKSYDGRVSSDGVNWNLAVQNLRSTHATVTGPYQTSEIPLTLTADVKTASGKVIEAGTVVGTTPPVTGVKFFSGFLRKLRDEGLMNSIVNVKVTLKPQKNNKGNEWGVLDFELLGEVE